MFPPISYLQLSCYFIVNSFSCQNFVYIDCFRRTIFEVVYIHWVFISIFIFLCWPFPFDFDSWTFLFFLLICSWISYIRNHSVFDNTQDQDFLHYEYYQMKIRSSNVSYLNQKNYYIESLCFFILKMSFWNHRCRSQVLATACFSSFLNQAFFVALLYQ